MYEGRCERMNRASSPAHLRSAHSLPDLGEWRQVWSSYSVTSRVCSACARNCVTEAALGGVFVTVP